jgi:hypothetical protein
MAVEGLRFLDDESVTIGYVTDLYALLRALDETMPQDSILYVEGTSIVPEIRNFLSSRQSPVSREIAPGTLWPKPETFHLPLVGTNLAELRALAQRHAEPEVTDHLAVYRGDDLLLLAYDAGDGEVEVARALPAQTVERLRLALGEALRGHS